MSEEKLPVEITQINRVQVDDVNLTKAGEDQVLKQFTADTTGAYQQDTGLFHQTVSSQSLSIRIVGPI